MIDFLLIHRGFGESLSKLILFDTYTSDPKDIEWLRNYLIWHRVPTCLGTNEFKLMYLEHGHLKYKFID